MRINITAARRIYLSPYARCEVVVKVSGFPAGDSYVEGALSPSAILTEKGVACDHYIRQCGPDRVYKVALRNDTARPAMLSCNMPLGVLTV